MPLYEYKCRECDNSLEVRQKFSDDPLTECPACGAENGLFRVVHAAGVVFKGSGFYITDSKGNRENLNTLPKRDGSDGGNSDSGNSNSGNGSKASTESSTSEKKSSSKNNSS